MSKIYTIGEEETNVIGIYYTILSKDILGTQNKILKISHKNYFEKNHLRKRKRL
jgi:hypothetical protein